LLLIGLLVSGTATVHLAYTCNTTIISLYTHPAVDIIQIGLETRVLHAYQSPKCNFIGIYLGSLAEILPFLEAQVEDLERRL